MHAVVLLAHFHALSSFIYGCGISAEVDSPPDVPDAGAATLLPDGTKLQERKGSSASIHVSY